MKRTIVAFLVGLVLTGALAGPASAGGRYKDHGSYSSCNGSGPSQTQSYRAHSSWNEYDYC